MKKIPVKQITSWSFSRYSDYKQCPLKAKLKHLDKIQEPPNEAMARGARVHEEAEQYIKGISKKLVPELKQFEKEFKRLRAQYKKKLSGLAVEDNWAFTKEWDQTQWNNWTQCWVRIKLDCAEQINDETLTITDWKTGKFRPESNEDYVEQLELYALAGFLMYDHIKTIYPRLVYLDAGVSYPASIQDAHEADLFFTREDLPELKKTWEKRVRPMLNDKKFAPRPNNRCHWCFYRSSNKAVGGGQCKY